MQIRILVEGASDEAALRTLAGRRSVDLAREGIAIRSLSGITNLRAELARHSPASPALRLLYDAAQEGYVHRVLGESGVPVMALACVEDLEDELIRALGLPSALEVVERAGDLKSFRLLQQQPAQRGRPEVSQLRRFISAHSGHKLRYARLLTAELRPDRVPDPLSRALAALAP